VVARKDKIKFKSHIHHTTAILHYSLKHTKFNMILQRRPNREAEGVISPPQIVKLARL